MPPAFAVLELPVSLFYNDTLLLTAIENYPGDLPELLCEKIKNTFFNKAGLLV